MNPKNSKTFAKKCQDGVPLLNPNFAAGVTGVDTSDAEFDSRVGGDHCENGQHW